MRLGPATAVIAMAIGLATPAAAGADGGPVLPIEGGTGAGAPGRSEHYVAIGTPHGTLVQRLRRGSVQRWTVLRGQLGVPAAAYDGSTTGLSADGRTLVLAGVVRSYPVRRTRLVVLDAGQLRVRGRLALPGYFTVDAISPDGRRLYLIHYTHGTDVLRYEVRAYDLPRRRLLARPIVDPREPDEAMGGIPFARTVSADGRWAYTLYARAAGAPFIHALDTRAGTAACVDLDELEHADVSALKLVLPPGGGSLRVQSPAGTQKVVDTRTFAVSDPPALPVASARGSTGGGQAWTAWAGAAAAVGCLALLVAVRRRRYATSGRGRKFGA